MGDCRRNRSFFSFFFQSLPAIGNRCCSSQRWRTRAPNGHSLIFCWEEPIPLARSMKPKQDQDFQLQSKFESMPTFGNLLSFSSKLFQHLTLTAKPWTMSGLWRNRIRLNTWSHCWSHCLQAWITVHGRTVRQSSSTLPDLDAIKLVQPGFFLLFYWKSHGKRLFGFRILSLALCRWRSRSACLWWETETYSLSLMPGVWSS